MIVEVVVVKGTRSWDAGGGWSRTGSRRGPCRCWWCCNRWAYRVRCQKMGTLRRRSEESIVVLGETASSLERVVVAVGGTDGGDLSERKSWELDRWRRHVQTGRLWLPALSISNFPFCLLMKGKH